MTSNITVVQWASIVFILLPIVILWANNRVLSARSETSQMLLGASLVCALWAAESASIIALLVSMAFFAHYAATLIQYYHVSAVHAKRQEPLPACKRP